jgi:Caspase domain
MQNDWALVVGINWYPRAVGIDQLQGAVGDAERFHKWVTKPTGGNVPEGQAKLVTSLASADPRPIKEEITPFLKDFVYNADRQPRRRLYIYLSGHGVIPASQQSSDETALLMANAITPRWPFSFGGGVWAHGARGTALFREVVLIMDCCRNLNDNVLSEHHELGDALPDAKNSRLVVAHATKWDAPSRELIFGNENGGKKQGAFTRSLLAVLESGRINGALLKASVEKHLALALKDEKKAQEPQIMGFPDLNHDLGKVIFSEDADPPRTPVAIKGANGAAAPMVLGKDASTGNLVPVQGWQEPSDPWRGTLAPGLYQLVNPAKPYEQRPFEILAGVPCVEEMPA